jgi:uncharacterized metal-binding protein
VPVLKTQKIGIIACSGEEMPEGLVTRLAALKVLQELRPGETVTLCLPLFLAGGEGDRSFAKLYPTIAIDGCELRCAYRATEKYSSRPAEGFVVTDFAKNAQLGEIAGLRKLNQDGMKAVDQIAESIAEKVDILLSKQSVDRSGNEIADTASAPMATATCSCGSGMLVARLMVNRKEREIVALPLIFENFQKDQKPLNDQTMTELMDTLKIYNTIPAEEFSYFQKAIMEAYQGFLSKNKFKGESHDHN